MIRPPKAELFQGQYRLNRRDGILSASKWSGVWAFRCAVNDDLLAYFAEEADWHEIVPEPWSSRLAAAPGANQYDMPIHCLEGVPLLRSRSRLSEGLRAPAEVPVGLRRAGDGRQSVTARQVQQAKRKGRRVGDGPVWVS